jgi:hypothetical protein
MSATLLAVCLTGLLVVGFTNDSEISAKPERDGIRHDGKPGFEYGGHFTTNEGLRCYRYMWHKSRNVHSGISCDWDNLPVN